jgi:DNA recombination protein RmuC
MNITWTTLLLPSGIIVLLILLALWRQHHRQCRLYQKVQQLNNDLLAQIMTNNDLVRKLSQEDRENLLQRLGEHKLQLQKSLTEFKETTIQAINQHRNQFDKQQLTSLQILQDSLQKGIAITRSEVKTSLSQHSEELSKRVEKLTQNTDQQLKEISGQVEKRLAEGFAKTTATFNDVVKRLALIDAAQKKITELSTNVVSLQEILADKRSRGAFGEVQLTALIRNMLSEKDFALQYTLSNGKRADCVIFLPKPTGNVAIDAKFPLEGYRRMLGKTLAATEKTSARKQFHQDIRKHIQNIAEKYIIQGETSNGAMMFIPAEAIFAEIHANFPELVETAQQARVWMVSPTTMMAILTTIRAVIKDEATREQVHIIQDHLGKLAKDFTRFQDRMDNLAKHVKLAHEDMEKVHTSSKKLTARFHTIEKVELDKKQIDH